MSSQRDFKTEKTAVETLPPENSNLSQPTRPFSSVMPQEKNNAAVGKAEYSKYSNHTKEVRESGPGNFRTDSRDRERISQPQTGFAAASLDTPPSPSTPIQAALTVEGDANYRKQVRLHLQKLVAAGMKVRVDNNGVVTLAGNSNSARQTNKPSHVLLNRLINHQHTTTIRARAGNEPMQSEPQNPRGFWRGTGDVFGDLFHWRNWGDTRKLRDRSKAGDPNQGSDSFIPFDPNLPARERQTRVLNKQTGQLENMTAPHHIVLAHELIHSDHFQRGTGAFNNQGRSHLGISEHRTGGVQQQEMQHIEEMNTVGLPSAQNPNQQFTQAHNIFGQHIPPLVNNPLYQSHLTRAVDPLAITENDIRHQFKIRKRRAY